MILTPEEQELLLYLIGAILIGFIFGYFFAKSLSTKVYKVGKEEEKGDKFIEKNYSSIVSPVDK